ncbi:hypothetical protein GCM10009693_01960 [Leucobacter chromiireducens subsp. chromiireducens]
MLAELVLLSAERLELGERCAAGRVCGERFVDHRLAVSTRALRTLDGLRISAEEYWIDHIAQLTCAELGDGGPGTTLVP